MRNALIAAVVAAVVAAASGTATTIVVTSKNIRNGTIQTVDLSAKAMRALKGNRGPQGRPGLPGPAGPQGVAGLQGRPGPGFSNLNYVQATGTAPPNGPGTATAQCAPGQIVLSGGGSVDQGIVYASRAVPPDAWLVGAHNDQPIGTATIDALALCGTPTP
jgi:hypothetical protein